MVDWRTPRPPARLVRVVGDSTPLEALTLPPFLNPLTPSNPGREDPHPVAPPGLAYAHWTTRFLDYHRPRNQALAALLFLFRHVFGRQMAPAEGVVRAKTQKRLPAVLSRGEVNAVLDRMSGVPGLVCGLLYGTGMRLTECLSLRVKDIDLDGNTVTVGAGRPAPTSPDL
jgi:integrase